MPPRRYATKTKVSPTKTAAELTDLLTQHGATQRLVATDDATGRVVIKFVLHGHVVRLNVNPLRCPLTPDASHLDRDAPRGWRGWGSAKRRDYIALVNLQAEREAWRRLLLLTKAKLEAIADGFTTIEHEFLPDLVLANGTTVGEVVYTQLADARAGGPLQLMP